MIFRLGIGIGIGLAATLFGGSAAGKTRLQNVRRLALAFVGRSAVECGETQDGFSATLTIRRAKMGALEPYGVLARSGPYLVRWRQGHDGSIHGFVDGSRGRVRCRVVSDKRGAELVIGVSDRRRRLVRLQQELANPRPRWATKQQQDAGMPALELVKKRDYLRALIALQELRRSGGPLESYAAIRMGDVHVITGRIPTAYAHFMSVHSLHGSIGVGLLAWARAAELAYLSDGTTPSAALVKETALDSDEPAIIEGRRIVVELLIESGLLANAQRLMAKSGGNGADQLKTVTAVLLRRSVIGGHHYEGALGFLRAEMQYRAPLADDLETLYWAGLAFAGLDLPKHAAAELQRALGLNGSDWQAEMILAALIDVYLRANDPYRARQAAQYYLYRYGKAPAAKRVRWIQTLCRIAEGDYPGATGELQMLSPDQADRLRQLIELRQDLGPRAPALNVASYVLSDPSDHSQLLALRRTKSIERRRGTDWQHLSLLLERQRKLVDKAINEATQRRPRKGAPATPAGKKTTTTGGRR
jgi:hypothetical protein